MLAQTASSAVIADQNLLPEPSTLTIWHQNASIRDYQPIQNAPGEPLRRPISRLIIKTDELTSIYVNSVNFHQPQGITLRPKSYGGG